MALVALNVAHDPHAIELVIVGQGLDEFSMRAAARTLMRELYEVFHAFDCSGFLERTSPALGLTAAPPVIDSIDRTSTGPLGLWLASLRLPGPRPADIATRWSAGATGLVIALLPSAGGRCELYEIYGGLAGVPIVAASQEGDGWTSLVVRALAQIHFGLLDEYERPGPEWQRPPSQFVGPAMNVTFLNNAQRASMLVPGTTVPLAELAGGPGSPWPVRGSDQFGLLAHSDPDTEVDNSVPQPPSDGVARLYEGAAGFRTYAARYAPDCLMRRIPGDDSLPVQDFVDFCPVCRVIIRRAAAAGDSHGLMRTMTSDRQQVRYDIDGPRGQAPHLTGDELRYAKNVQAEKAGDVTWELDAKVDVSGLSFANILLSNRPDDPFTSSPRLIADLGYSGLAVRFASEAADRELDPAMAVAQPDAALDTYVGDAAESDALGHRLGFAWKLDNGWTIEAICSLVLRRTAATVDPGRAVMGVKLFPQVALRAVRTPGYTGSLPAVEYFYAAVDITADNVIAPVDEPMMMQTGVGMADGKPMADTLIANLFTDTNTARENAQYRFIPGVVDLSPWLPWPGRKIPVPGYTWRSGRRLAGIQAFGAYHANLTAATWFAHTLLGGPPLGLWSWLFDYCQPDCVSSTSEVWFPAVWAQSETTWQHNSAATTRESQLTWPPKGEFADTAGDATGPVLIARKLPRQGAYDNVHVTPPMGTDPSGRTIIAAPFCGDKCLHLHWRWGVDGIDAASAVVPDPRPFRGWSAGALATAGAVLGAPLVPPNQHIDVRVKRLADDKIALQYAMTAYRPQPGQWQVALEQGLGFAFSYQGFGTVPLVAASSATLGSVEPPVIDAMERRKLFVKMYARQRWFDPDMDGAQDKLTQQIPDMAQLDATLRGQVENA